MQIIQTYINIIIARKCSEEMGGSTTIIQSTHNI